MEQPERMDDGRRFGRYLRRIREQRKLSLDAVEEMSLGYRERVTKSHLSRIESGQATPSFPRMFTLSQIYGVPVTSLAERFELELVREQVAVDVTDWSEKAVFEALEKLKLTGKYLEILSITTLGRDRFRGADSAIRHELHLYYIDSLIHLERYETGKVESELLLGAARLDPQQRIKALLCFATCCYRLKRHTVAQMALEKAESLMAEGAAPKLVAVLASLHAGVLYALDQFTGAQEAFSRAIEMYDAVPDPFEACRARVNLGQALIASNQLPEARDRLMEALKIAEERGYDRPLALALSHLGLLACRSGQGSTAEVSLLRSNTIARSREYLTVLFRNCYYLRDLARKRGDEQSARSNERALRAYLGRIDGDLPEAMAFRDELVRGSDE